MAKATKNSHRPNKFLPVFKAILAAIAGLLAVFSFVTEVHGLAILFTALFLAATVSTQIEAGWVIPCAICGTLVGTFVIPPIRSGPVDTTMEIRALFIGAGAGIGMLIGFLLDSQDKKSKDKPPEKSVSSVPTRRVPALGGFGWLLVTIVASAILILAVTVGLLLFIPTS